MAKKAAEKFTAFDAAEYLDNEEAIAAYLEAAQEDSLGDPNVMAMVLSDIARARNMSQLAKDAGLTRAGLYNALAPDGNPRISTLHNIAKALGLKLTLTVA
jgi:probable addiction module antidote protein